MRAAILRVLSSPAVIALGLLLLVDSVYDVPPVVAVIGIALLALAWLAARIRRRSLPAATPSPLERGQWVSLGSAVAFVALAFYFFRSWEIAWVVMASLAVHELGHMVAARLLGVPAVIGFGLLGAWTWTPLARRQSLSHTANVLIHLAGPVASLLYAMLALAWHFRLGGGGDYWLRLANLNALLCLLNLLPLGGLSDGGKTVRRLLGAASSRTRQELLLLFILLPIVVAWLLLNLPLAGMRAVILVGVVLWYGLALLAHGHERRGNVLPVSGPGTIMDAGRARALLSLVMVLLLASVGLVLLTPFWLTEGHALGMVVEHGSLLHYVLIQAPAALRMGLGIAVTTGMWALNARRTRVRSVARAESPARGPITASWSATKRVAAS